METTPIAASLAHHVEEPKRTRELRTLFWQNVVQAMLVSFPERAAECPEITDGRLGVMTHGGERIAIKGVVPLFSLSVPTNPEQRMLSVAVQCTVFEIHTPDGEVVTVPLEEIRGVHSLSEDLIEQLKAMSQARQIESGEEPFGFAAFTSMAREQEVEIEDKRAK